jgi:hypothetical protein
VIFEHVTPQEMQAARVVTGATMVGFLTAGVFDRHAQTARIVIASVYFAAVIGFVLYYLL